MVLARVVLATENLAVTPAPESHPGIILCRSVLASPELAAWAAEVDARYLSLEAVRRQHGPIAPDGCVAPGERFVPTASSFTLGELFSGEKLRALFRAIFSNAAGQWLAAELLSPPVCNLSQSWVRRQFAPGNYPPWHAPHGWHQDGALGFDFLALGEAAAPPDAILDMVTCWIALAPCGTDAPGLEFVTRRLGGLCPLPELAEARVRACFTPAEFWRPVMNPGDALLFRGDLLHRTYVTPEMSRDRTSIELRFFPTAPMPTRLARDRFVVPELSVTPGTTPGSGTR